MQDKKFFSAEKLQAGKAAFAKISSIGSDAKENIRHWISSVLVRSIQSCSDPQDRVNALAWLALVREELAAENSSIQQKARSVYQLVNSKTAAHAVVRSVSQSIENYKKSDLPLAVKVAVPITLAASAVIGGQGAGVAVLGGAIGIPALALVFIGAAGVTSVIEAFLKKEESRDYIGVVMALIAQDQAIMSAKQALREAMQASPAAPKRAPAETAEHSQFYQSMLDLAPYEFEQHVMSLFQSAGMLAWMTKQSNDFGVDGFARHPEGLIVVQCKRYAADNRVGRPAVQQFKGVVEENAAYLGFIVTTSSFTEEAKNSAAMNDKVVLVELEQLFEWSKAGKAMIK
jgi:HJR/Mrr/RecB family endonuclease